MLGMLFPQALFKNEILRNLRKFEEKATIGEKENLRKSAESYGKNYAELKQTVDLNWGKISPQDGLFAPKKYYNWNKTKQLQRMTKDETGFKDYFHEICFVNILLGFFNYLAIDWSIKKVK